MFWRLGFTNARRNTARSLLAIVSMALAAAFLTYAISLSRGYTGSFRNTYRAINGGEIVLYNRQLTGAASQGVAMEYGRLEGVENTDLAQVMPHLLSGFLSSTLEPIPITPQRIQDMSAVDGVRGVYPRYQMPAMSSGSSRLKPAPLRGRDPVLDNLQVFGPQNLVVEGRWLDASDDGKMVAVVAVQRDHIVGQATAGLGEELRLVVPRILYEGENTLYDYRDPLLLTFNIIGIMDVPLRTLLFTTEDGQSASLALFMNCDEVQIPLTTWQEVWKQAGGREFTPQQLAVMVNDMSYLEDIAVTLQSRYPEYTVYSVPQLLDQVESTFTLENPSKLVIIPEARQAAVRSEPIQQSGVAMDLRIPLSIMIFINAALVNASNLLIMVNERRTEIGILKAMGARRIEIVQMVLAEACFISMTGALWGFILFRLPGIFVQVSNNTPFTALIGSLQQDLLFICGVTTASTLVFGMMPAFTMAKMSVREVLSGE